MEHENRLFKERLKTYRGEFTQAHLDRISKGRSQIKNMIRTFDKQIGYHGASAATRVKLVKRDVGLLCDLYATANLTKQMTATRVHSTSTCNVTRNLTCAMNGSSLKNWLLDRISLCKIRQYYRQFQESATETVDDTTSLELVPDSDVSELDMTIASLDMSKVI